MRPAHLIRDVFAITALAARWVGAHPERIASDIVRALLHANPRLTFVGVRLVVDGSAPVESSAAGRGMFEPVAGWADATEDADDGKTCRIPVGIHGERGHIVLSVAAAPIAPDDRLLPMLAANQAEAALRSFELERRVVRAQERISALEKVSSLGQLVGGVAHEIRTPLTYATNNLYLLDREIRALVGEEGAAKVAPLSKEIEAGLDRIAAIVKQLRRFAKHEADVQREEDLRDSVRDALRLFRATHAGSGPIKEDLAPTPPVLVDRVQIQQILLNLLQNASEAVGNRGKVRVITRSEPNAAIIEVEDDGEGMSAEVQAGLFQPFITTKQGGLGLGLSIVRRIVDTHGGTIRVHSAKGEGTRVTVRIPRAPRERTPSSDDAVAGDHK